MRRPCSAIISAHSASDISARHGRHLTPWCRASDSMPCSAQHSARSSAALPKASMNQHRNKPTLVVSAKARRSSPLSPSTAAWSLSSMTQLAEEDAAAAPCSLPLRPPHSRDPCPRCCPGLPHASRQAPTRRQASSAPTRPAPQGPLPSGFSSSLLRSSCLVWVETKFPMAPLRSGDLSVGGFTPSMTNSHIRRALQSIMLTAASRDVLSP